MLSLDTDAFAGQGSLPPGGERAPSVRYQGVEARGGWRRVRAPASSPSRHSLRFQALRSVSSSRSSRSRTARIASCSAGSSTARFMSYACRAPNLHQQQEHAMACESVWQSVHAVGTCHALRSPAKYTAPVSKLPSTMASCVLFAVPSSGGTPYMQCIKHHRLWSAWTTGCPHLLRRGKGVARVCNKLPRISPSLGSCMTVHSMIAQPWQACGVILQPGAHPGADAGAVVAVRQRPPAGRPHARIEVAVRHVHRDEGVVLDLAHHVGADRAEPVVRKVQDPPLRLGLHYPLHTPACSSKPSCFLASVLTGAHGCAQCAGEELLCLDSSAQHGEHLTKVGGTWIVEQQSGCSCCLQA